MGRSGILSRLRGRRRRSSTPSSSVLEKIRQAAKEAKLDDLSKDIAEYFELIKHGEEKPSPAEYDRPRSTSLINLMEVLKGVADTAKEFVPEAKTIAKKALQGVGELHILATGFLVLGNIMERFETISSNKDECLCLLERMNNLIQEVNRLRERPGLMKAMEAEIKEAIELIIVVSLACCTQIDRSTIKKFFSTTVNKKELEGFQTRLTELHRKIQLEMELVLHDLLLRVPPCPRASEEFRRENKAQIDSITQQLQWETEERAVAVILYGLGGTGKTALADAVYWSLYHGKVLPYKYSYVRLFDPMIPVPDITMLQTQILQDLTFKRPGIRRYDLGQVAILQVLQKEEVFIYIDNVLFPAEVEQGGDAIEKLLPRTTKEVKKLRLLITTRDKGAAVNACKRLRIKRELYPIETLEDTKAMQLVKEELNGRDEQLLPKQIYQIVEICGGIPQILKEVAAYIGVSENREEAQKRYHQVIWDRQNAWNGQVDGQVEWNKIARYAFAHDHLDEKLKDPLFDICSYFEEGWNWEELSNIVGKSELDSLEDRALVTKDVNSMTAKVHNVILAIGIHNKGRRFKFTNASEFEKVLKEDLCGIKGIWSNDNIGPLVIPASKLDLMCGSLRVLALQNSITVRGRCNGTFKELYFFSAEISHNPFDPSKVENLRYSRYSQMPPNGEHGTIQLLGLNRLIPDRLKKLPDGFCSLSFSTIIARHHSSRNDDMQE